MTSPTVTPLAVAPARLTRPDEFVNESVLFIDSLPTFRTQTNDLSGYLNATIINKWDYGSVAVAPSFPDITQYTGDVIPTETATVEYIASIDSYYGFIKEYSTKLNGVGEWIDSLVSYVGVIPYDIDKPLVNGITEPHARNQDRPLFNERSEMFTETGIDNVNSMYHSCWYNYTICFVGDDYGLVTDTNLTVREDYGLVTDTTITY